MSYEPPTKELCEQRVKKYYGDERCQQAYDHFKNWLDYHNGTAPAPTMVLASSDKTENN